MKLPDQISTSKVLLVASFLVALVVIPVGVIQLQQQQELRQRAEGEISVQWLTSQSASTSCPTGGSGAVISVSFTNTEPNQPSMAMNVTALDEQTNKSVNLGSIAGGQTKTGQIQTGKTALNAGTVKFSLSWTDGHSGTDSRTADYKAVGNCQPPTPTPSPTPAGPTPTGTRTPTPTPTKTPTPTICPTLGPVQNVHIDCPNCPK